MKIMFSGLFFLVFWMDASAMSCSQEKQRVENLTSELIVLDYLNNNLGHEKKKALERAADLGEPLALTILATREELPIEKRIALLQFASSLEYSPADLQLIDLLRQSNKIVSSDEYQFQMIRRALITDKLAVRDLQELALRSNQKHHLISAIFWSIVDEDPTNNSMRSSQSRANRRLLEKKIPAEQLAELKERAILFRCERQVSTKSRDN
jgi:hypothetical protein